MFKSFTNASSDKKEACKLSFVTMKTKKMLLAHFQTFHSVRKE